MSSIFKIRELPTPERKLIREVNLATSASVERSFSTAQRLKTWLCGPTMTRAIYELDINGRSLVDFANKFSDRNDNRRRNFGRK